MNNRHLYKAKRLDNGEWAEGYYAFDYRCSRHMIFINEASCTEGSKPRRKEYSLTGYDIDPSTLCKCTGIEDKNDKPIWENDIITFEDTGEEVYEYKEGFDFQNRAVVVWNNGRFELDKLASDNSAVLEDMNNCHEDFWNDLIGCEVIGNIFDNPELLEEQE